MSFRHSKLNIVFMKRPLELDFSKAFSLEYHGKALVQEQTDISNMYVIHPK